MSLRILNPAALAFFLLLASHGGALGQATAPATLPALPQQYAATAVGQSGALSGKTFGISVFITKWTSDEEAQTFATALVEKGPDGLQKSLQKASDVGRVSPVGAVGSEFRIARARPSGGGGFHIVMVSDRPIRTSETYNSSRSRNYKFGIISLDVDKDGKGSGTLAPICKIKIDKQGQVQIEHYGQKPLRLIDVRLNQ